MATPNGAGKIITFYSYKGGTGRSMSLANIAWVLASNGRRVLAVDWDLEAPGLHRYFYPFLVDKELTSSDGVIDFMIDFEFEAITPLKEGEVLDKDWYKPHADILRYAASLDWEFPGDGTLDFIPAGRQGDSYSSRVTSFNWQKFYDKLGGGVFLEAVKERMREEYDYILIDSRTGVSDASGICTVQMPDALAICFTLNHQSIEGASAVAASVYEQRRRAGSPVQVFPVPMRVENGEKEKLERRLDYAKKHFDLFPAHIPPEKRPDYWGEVEVIYVPYYAYEEILAPFGDQRGQTVSLLAASERLTAYLTKDDPQGKVKHLAAPPEQERRRVLAEYSRIPSDGAPTEEESQDPWEGYLDAAEGMFASLTHEQQVIAKRVLTRLVRLSPPEEVGADTRLRVRIGDLGADAEPILNELAYQQLIFLEEDEATKEETVELAHDALVQKWKRMRGWLSEDRDFLLWRQGLQLNIAKWESAGRIEAALLHGAFLKEAQDYKITHASLLTGSEHEFIVVSTRAEQEASQRLRLREEEAKRETIKAREEKRRLGLRMGALVTVLLLTAAISYPFIFHREGTLIYLGVMPSPYVGAWSDDFLIRQDHLPDSALWDYPTDYPAQGWWVIQKGDGTSPDDGALVVGGTNIGIVKLTSSKFYDFNAEFKVRFVQGEKAAWLFRAQADKRNGYLFVLEKQTTEPPVGGVKKSTLVLKGYIYRGTNNFVPIDSRGDREIPIRDCCRDDDAFHIRAEVKDYEFRYWVTLESNVREEDSLGSLSERARDAKPARDGIVPENVPPGISGEIRPDLGREFFLDPFKDVHSLFRYGTIGLLEPDGSSQMKVEYMTISSVQ